MARCATCGAGEGTRTPTSNSSPGPKPGASSISATPAKPPPLETGWWKRLSGSPGNRTQNLRIKSPVLCLVELATRRCECSNAMRPCGRDGTRCSPPFASVDLRCADANSAHTPGRVMMLGSVGRGAAFANQARSLRPSTLPHRKMRSQRGRRDPMEASVCT